MSIEEFLKNPEWDTPFFKRLASNDTAEAPGHQAGMVFPKALRQYLPNLDETGTSGSNPTVDRYLRAELLDGTLLLTESPIRYQLQTWGGTRSAESRITNGFQPIRDRARGGDLLLFQRRANTIDQFRLLLIRARTPEFSVINSLAGGLNWGPLYKSDPPATQSDVIAAQRDIIRLAEVPFEVLRPNIPRTENRQSRIARSTAFSVRVRSEYSKRCAVSRVSISTPTFLYEVEAAHVVPISENGSDDIRNGLALSQSLHWAFDRGLFGVTDERKIYVPRRVLTMVENTYLAQFHGKGIEEASRAELRVHPEAFRWHFKNKVKVWD